MPKLVRKLNSLNTTAIQELKKLAADYQLEDIQWRKEIKDEKEVTQERVFSFAKFLTDTANFQKNLNETIGYDVRDTNIDEIQSLSIGNRLKSNAALLHQHYMGFAAYLIQELNTQGADSPAKSQKLQQILAHFFRIAGSHQHHLIVLAGKVDPNYHSYYHDDCCDVDFCYSSNSSDSYSFANFYFYNEGFSDGGNGDFDTTSYLFSSSYRNGYGDAQTVKLIQQLFHAGQQAVQFEVKTLLDLFKNIPLSSLKETARAMANIGGNIHVVVEPVAQLVQGAANVAGNVADHASPCLDQIAQGARECGSLIGQCCEVFGGCLKGWCELFTSCCSSIRDLDWEALGKIIVSLGSVIGTVTGSVAGAAENKALSVPTHLRLQQNSSHQLAQNQTQQAFLYVILAVYTALMAPNLMHILYKQINNLREHHKSTRSAIKTAFAVIGGVLGGSIGGAVKKGFFGGPVTAWNLALAGSFLSYECAKMVMTKRAKNKFGDSNFAAHQLSEEALGKFSKYLLAAAQLMDLLAQNKRQIKADEHRNRSCVVRAFSRVWWLPESEAHKQAAQAERDFQACQLESVNNYIQSLPAENQYKENMVNLLNHIMLPLPSATSLVTANNSRLFPTFSSSSSSSSSASSAPPEMVFGNGI